MPTLIVKLKNDVSPERGLARVRALIGAKDLGAAQQLFPGDTEPETATLLEVELKDSARLEDVVEKIRGASEVEYAHLPSNRRTL
jgi:hypothetical protein